MDVSFVGSVVRAQRAKPLDVGFTAQHSTAIGGWFANMSEANEQVMIISKSWMLHSD